MEAIANLAQRKARMKIPEILQALEGHRLGDHHRRMLRLSLEHLAFLEQQISAIDAEALPLIEPEGYQTSFDLLQSIPGAQEISAAALLSIRPLWFIPCEGHVGFGRKLFSQEPILEVQPEENETTCARQDEPISTPKVPVKFIGCFSAKLNGRSNSWV